MLLQLQIARMSLALPLAEKVHVHTVSTRQVKSWKEKVKMLEDSLLFNILISRVCNVSLGSFDCHCAWYKYMSVQSCF